MAKRRREGMLNVRTFEIETAMLRELADHDGINASDWIRLTIRQRYRKLFGDRPPQSSKPRQRTK
jgi:hypothetical protein